MRVEAIEDPTTKRMSQLDKLIDELVDAKDERSSDAVEINQFYNLLKLIFNNAKLGYGGEELRLENETAIFEYLRVIDPTGYETRLNRLKDEREAERKRLEALNTVKAKEAKGKEEA